MVTLTVLAMLQSLHIHGHLHVKAALDSGDLTEAELREIAVQIACYAGWPVATANGPWTKPPAGHQEWRTCDRTSPRNAGSAWPRTADCSGTRPEPTWTLRRMAPRGRGHGSPS
ncbi:carboxymuconolactone decarboxylase family protein [Streptomyces sp. NPDC054765]